MRRYCFDTDVLIQSKNGPYGFDIVPAFWDWLESQFSAGTIFTSKLVYGELVKGRDELSKWIQLRNRDYFIEPDENVQSIYQQIADYVNRQFPQHHVEEFLRGADPWVIAQAKAEDAIVVTHEVLVPSDSTKIKIPNICKYFGVSHIGLYQMIRNLGAKNFT